MKKGYVGLLACASGILIGLGISRLDLTGYLEKTQEQENSAGCVEAMNGV